MRTYVTSSIANDNNAAIFAGEIATEVAFHHENKAAKFYILKLKIQRTSGLFDVIPIIMSENIYENSTDLSVGKKVYVEAQLRSYNEENNGKRRVLVFAYATSNILPFESGDNNDPDINVVQLKCCLCKAPNYRLTPNNRRITDLMLVINRVYNKSDYIPAIAWGLNAELSANITTKDKLWINGRFQSRDYYKVLEDGSSELRTSYEVSITEIIINPDDVTDDGLNTESVDE